MSFVLGLTAGSVKAMWFRQSMPYGKPFLQILNLEQIGSRYKFILSDGVHSVPAVLSPALNVLVYQKQIKSNSIIRLVCFACSLEEGQRFILVKNLHDIVSTVATTLGSPIPLESFPIEPESDIRPSFYRSLDSLADNLSPLLNDPQFSDISFILIDGQQIRAHKNILMARAPYFKSLLTNGMKETKEKEFLINDWEPDVFKAVLRFIYCDQMAWNPATDIDRIWDIFLAGKFYGLERLCRLCETFIVQEKMKTQQLPEIWNTAHELGANYTENCCYRIMELRFEKMVKSEEFLSLPKEIFQKLVISEKLVLSSEEV